MNIFLFVLVPVTLISADDSACCFSDKFMFFSKFEGSMIKYNNPRSPEYTLRGKTSHKVDFPGRFYSSYFEAEVIHSTGVKSRFTARVGINGDEKLAFIHYRLLRKKAAQSGWSTNDVEADTCVIADVEDIEHFKDFQCIQQQGFHAGKKTKNGLVELIPDHRLPHRYSHRLEYFVKNDTCAPQIMNLDMDVPDIQGQIHFYLDASSTTRLNKPDMIFHESDLDHRCKRSPKKLKIRSTEAVLTAALSMIPIAIFS